MELLELQSEGEVMGKRLEVVVLLIEQEKMPEGVPAEQIWHLLLLHLLKPGGRLCRGRVTNEGGLVLIKKLPRFDCLLRATIGLLGRTLDMRSDLERMDLCFLWKLVGLGI